jgi:hypothetical protein
MTGILPSRTTQLSEISLRYLGARWRLAQESNLSAVVSILAALARPEFAEDMSVKGTRAGEDLYLRIARMPDYLGRTPLGTSADEIAKSQVPKMLAEAYVSQIEEIKTLALNLGFIRHCSIFESFLKDVVLTFHQANPEIRARGDSLSKSGDFAEHFGKIRGIKEILQFTKRLLEVDLSVSFERRDLFTDLPCRTGEETRKYLDFAFKERNDIVHSLSSTVVDINRLRTVSHFFEQVTSSMYRDMAAKIGIRAAI